MTEVFVFPRGRKRIDEELHHESEHISGDLAVVELRMIRLQDQIDELIARLPGVAGTEAKPGGDDPPG